MVQGDEMHSDSEERASHRRGRRVCDSCDCTGRCACCDRRHWRSHKTVHQTVSWGFPSFLAYVGAAIYFIGQTTGGFWVVVLALLKAAVWPAFVVYHVLVLLGA